MANFWLAFEQDLAILPIVNKVDLGHADVQGALAQMATAFDTDADEALQISAKTGLGTARMWQAVLLAPQRTALASRGCPPRGRLLRCCAMHSGRANGPSHMRPLQPPSLHHPASTSLLPPPLRLHRPGTPALLPRVLSHVPPPAASAEAPLRVLLFDSWYDDLPCNPMYPRLQPCVCTRGCSPTRARGCSSYVCSSYVYQVR